MGLGLGLGRLRPPPAAGVRPHLPVPNPIPPNTSPMSKGHWNAFTHPMTLGLPGTSRLVKSSGSARWALSGSSNSGLSASAKLWSYRLHLLQVCCDKILLQLRARVIRGGCRRFTTPFTPNGPPLVCYQNLRNFIITSRQTLLANPGQLKNHLI